MTLRSTLGGSPKSAEAIQGVGEEMHQFDALAEGLRARLQAAVINRGVMEGDSKPSVNTSRPF